MARINLLPWRAEKRKKRQRDFLVSMGFFAASTLVLVLGADLYVRSKIETQLGRNQYLQDQIKEVDARITEINTLEKQKQQLVDRMKVIERLQQGRPEIVHLFDEIVKATPDGLFLTSITQRGNVLTIEGISQSNARVSQFMRSLDASPWFENPTLNIIESKDPDKSDRRKFSLTVPQTVQDESQAGAPGKPLRPASGTAHPSTNNPDPSGKR